MRRRNTALLRRLDLPGRPDLPDLPEVREVQEVPVGGGAYLPLADPAVAGSMPHLVPPT